MQDINSQHYVMKKLWALPWKTVSPVELPVLLRLAFLMDDQNVASPLLKELARSIQCSVRTVSRATGSLAAKGFITKSRLELDSTRVFYRTAYEVNVNKILELSNE